MSYIELKLLLVLNDFLVDKSGINTPVRNKKPQPHSTEIFRNHQAIWFPDDFRIQSRVSALREAGE